MTAPALYDHRRWLGFIQPIRLVVSPPALVAAQAILNLNMAISAQPIEEVIAQHPVSFVA